ncbi:MAG: fimbrillin family protein, partial [Muribaculaceae bacterium]|nr:fimbrillin family protein [Muribaculaceae bacterium]
MNTIKATYLTLGATLFLASCAADVAEPIITPDGAPMCFSTSLPENASRAQIVGNENLTEFNVTVFNPAYATDGSLEPYISNSVVTKSDDDGMFYSEDCKWPAQGKEKPDLTFFAYYPATTTPVNNTTINGTQPAFDFKMPNFSISDDISKQVDFIAAYKKVSMKSEMFTKIQLEFDHRLSLIEVNAKGSNKSCKIEIACILIGSTYSHA